MAFHLLNLFLSAGFSSEAATNSAVGMLGSFLGAGALVVAVLSTPIFAMIPAPFSFHHWIPLCFWAVEFVDLNNKTLVSASSIKAKPTEKYKKIDLSTFVADMLAKKALEKNIKNVYFDRGAYKYHGRIKTFAEALRKNGLNF